jgi:hypothetical protein
MVGDNLHFGAKVHQEIHSRVSFDLGISVAFGPHPQQGHQLIQKVFFQNGERTAMLLRGRNPRSSGPGMLLQKKCKKHYADSSKNITISLLSKKSSQKCYYENNI